MNQDVRFLKPYLWFVGSVLFVLFLSRSALIFWQYDRVVETGGLFYILLQGFRFDLVLISLILLLPLSLTPLLLVSQRIKKHWLLLSNTYLLISFVIIVFIELSTPSFINQFDLRPNVLFIEYLKYPKEVMSTLWEAYRFQLIATVIITVMTSVWLYKKLRNASDNIPAIKLHKAVFYTPVLLLVALVLARSTLGHRAVNPSTVAFSSDPLVNTLPMSSGYSVLYALKEMLSESSKDVFYGQLPEQEVIDIVKREMHVKESAFTGDSLSTRHVHLAQVKRDKPLNIVIILEESLGAEFVGSLGGLPLTPSLDALSKQGMWFEHMYATGTRSVRGIEAVVTGFLPTPQRSVVKLSKSQTNFFTAAELLKAEGYETSFIYGGEAHFDNMKRFFANNGFEKIIEEKDFKNPAFTGSWGASDEDLFAKAHQQFESYSDEKPFFSLVFTSSNHAPYEFPDGRIKLYDAEKQTVNNAVKYADYALGQFFEKAKQSSYWKNTVFLVVADHNSRVYGAELVPVNRFHIPALIIGADIEAKHFKHLASQIDLLPTLLSVAGIDAEYPAIGHDLVDPVNANSEGRAIMQFGGTQAYMQEDGRVVVLQKNKEPVQYVYRHDHLKSSDVQDRELVKTALAHSIWASKAYQQSRYH